MPPVAQQIRRCSRRRHKDASRRPPHSPLSKRKHRLAGAAVLSVTHMMTTPATTNAMVADGGQARWADVLLSAISAEDRLVMAEEIRTQRQQDHGQDRDSGGRRFQGRARRCSARRAVCARQGLIRPLGRPWRQAGMKYLQYPSSNGVHFPASSMGEIEDTAMAARVSKPPSFVTTGTSTKVPRQLTSLLLLSCSAVASGLSSGSNNQ